MELIKSLRKECRNAQGAPLVRLTRLRLKPLTLLCVLVLTSGCYSVKKTVEESKPYSDQIEWPEPYTPETSEFFVHNEIDIQADPQVVWQLLIAAEAWEGWYEGAENVRISQSDAGNLGENSVFTWNTMGQEFTSRVREFEPPFRLSWESEKKNIRGYHAWLILPTDTGCRVITSESQRGFLATMEKVFIPNKLRKLHDIWLAGIKNKAENKEL